MQDDEYPISHLVKELQNKQQEQNSTLFGIQLPQSPKSQAKNVLYKPKTDESFFFDQEPSISFPSYDINLMIIQSPRGNWQERTQKA